MTRRTALQALIALLLLLPAMPSAAGTDIRLPRDWEAATTPPKRNPLALSYVNACFPTLATPGTLTYDGPETIPNGTVVNGMVIYTGAGSPTCGDAPLPFPFPYLGLDLTRQTLLIHPWTDTPIGLHYKVLGTKTDTVRLVGGFGRANDLAGAGNGVTVHVLKNGAPIASGAIASNHAVDPDRPLAGTGTFAFNESIQLGPNDTVSFVVDDAGDTTFDVTALAACFLSPSPLSLDAVPECFVGEPTRRDLAVTAIKARRSVRLRPRGTISEVTVQIENRGLLDADLAAPSHLSQLAGLSVRALTPGCSDAAVSVDEARLGAVLSRPLRPKERRSIPFLVEFTCAGDYVAEAAVDRSVIDGELDQVTANDVCPRTAPAPFVPEYLVPERGCGEERADGTFGDPVVVHVVER